MQDPNYLPPPPPPPPTRSSKKMIIVLVSIIAISVIIAGAYVATTNNAGTNQIPNFTPTPSSSNTPLNSPTTSNGDTVTGNTVKFKTESYTDLEGTGGTAFTILVPTTWQFQGNINWVLDNPAMPATAQIRVWNPSGTEEFCVFPNQAFFSTDNPLVQQTNPEGSTYFGALVKTPLGSIEALKEVALPMFRGNVESLNIVSEQKLPQLDQLFRSDTDPVSGISYSAESGKIKVEYQLNGVLMEDELYCVIQSVKIPVQSMYGTVTNDNWYMSYLASFRAEKGKLDAQSELMQTIAFSAKTDKNWLNQYNQLVYNLLQNQVQQIQSIGELSRMLSQTSSEISDQNLNDWQQRQNVNDQIVTNFCNNILEVQPYNNPIDGSTVNLPSGYTSVWTNNLGEYVLADSNSYNPNVGSNQNWQQMTIPTN